MGGTSDALDALAIARAALREPRLDHPRAGEERLRELKLLLDHRGDLLAERRRAQQRLRWHLHELDPSLTVPPAALDRGLWLERLGRWLARRQQTTQVRIARELVTRCRSLSRSIAELEAELQARAETLAPRLLELPGCGPLSAAKLLKRDRPDRALRKRRPARSRDDAEVGRVCANRLVLGDRHHYRLRALRSTALAGEIDGAGVGFDLVVGGDLGHALVDLAEECLVRSEPLLPPTAPLSVVLSSGGGSLVGGGSG